jgi:hypothetical protein
MVYAAGGTLGSCAPFAPLMLAVLVVMIKVEVRVVEILQYAQEGLQMWACRRCRVYTLEHISPVHSSQKRSAASQQSGERWSGGHFFRTVAHHLIETCALTRHTEPANPGPILA